MKIYKHVDKTLVVWEQEYKKGFTAYMILYFLNTNDMYGYEIKNKLENFTSSDLQFQESGIYKNLKKLKIKNYVKSEIRSSDKGPNRKYYTITESGRNLLKTFTEEIIYPVSKSIVNLIENDRKE
jgi:PadR family transcriptional regulator PadR